MYERLRHDLADRKQSLITHLLTKVTDGNFHAVHQAALDLIVIDAQLTLLRQDLDPDLQPVPAAS